MSDSTKYLYPTTGGINILIPPSPLLAFKNSKMLNPFPTPTPPPHTTPPPCPQNPISVKPSSLPFKISIFPPIPLEFPIWFPNIPNEA